MTTDAAPIPGISGAEAAEVLGVRSELYVYKRVSQGVIAKARKHANSGLDRADVERVALARVYRPRHPYWVTTGEAAELLGVARGRVSQLVTADKLPVVRAGGRRFYRRHQVEVIANARLARREDARSDAA